MTTEQQTTLNSEIEILLTAIKTTQAAYVLTNGKYKQEQVVDTGTLTYEVHEYVSNKGIGFTCIFKATESEKDYIKTVGFGTESDSRTSDWTEIIEDDLI